MTRIGQDYIALGKRPRRFTRVKWLALALAVPMVAGAIGLMNQSPGVAAAGPLNGKTIIELTPATLQPSRPTADRDAAGSTGHAIKVNMPIAPGTHPMIEMVDGLGMAGDPGWVEVEIERGDTLSLAFERHQLSYRDSLAIANLDRYGKRFTRGLRAGDTLRVRATDGGHVLAVDLALDNIRTLQIRAAGGGYTAQVEKAEVEYRTAYAVGTIDTSFYVDALEAGLPDSVIMDLAYIFGWDIDFVLDIRAGDRFAVVYQQIYHEGEKVGDGAILAAEFYNQGRHLQALRFTDPKGDTAYYTPEGEAMQKAFIRTPLDQFRISSHFSLGREHPILNTIRAHEGTDYAAPTGTPIKATGNGRITRRGVNGGYGKMVVIDHGNGYTTRYGHMSRFASGQSVGTRVHQGEVIGYVGMSGLATGPHLHYEFRSHGVPRNPVTVDLPGAPPIPENLIADFNHQTQSLLAQLQTLGHTLVAQNSTGD